MKTKSIWLDCDPGHDDATAILLAIHASGVRLLGVSTVHGNSDAECTYRNAQRCLYAFGAPVEVDVYRGATTPLLRPVKHDPEIHGADGLGGVHGLPTTDEPAVQARMSESQRRNAGPYNAVEGIARAIRDEAVKGRQMTLISTGPMTNIALFLSVYPELLTNVEQIVFMGGGVGLGNRSAVAEFNILCDPEAAQIVLNAPVSKTMIPLNVTHTAILTEDVHTKLLSPDSANASASLNSSLTASTPLRHTLSTLISFFAEAYKSTFGFSEGPPLHDALTIAYVCLPELFQCSRQRVDIELSGTHTAGETIVDVWNYRKCDDSWGANGKNCVVAEAIDVPAFFDMFLNCIQKCDRVSPLNQ